jgi:diphthine-ammonia ligase
MHPILVDLVIMNYLPAVFHLTVRQNSKYGSHICGEGGEFESLTIDCPLFVKKLVIDEVETVVHSNDAFAIVAYLRIKKAHLEPKENSGYLSEECRKTLLRSQYQFQDDNVESIPSSTYNEILDVVTETQLPSLSLDKSVPPLVSICYKSPFLCVSGVVDEDSESGHTVEVQTKNAMTRLQSM